ncbi:MAG: MFS transporter [Pseudomonadota bacterium]
MASSKVGQDETEQDETEFDSAYSWGRLALSLVIATVGNAGMWAVILLLPAVQAEFGVPRADATLPYTLTMIGFAIGNLVIGRAVDRYGIAVALIGAAIICGAGYFLVALAPTMVLVTVLHFLIGLGTAACFGPLIADISLWFMTRRGIAVAIAACGNYLSGAIWPFILTPILASHGWRGAYVVLGIATLAVMVPLSLFLTRRISDTMTAKADAVSAIAAGASGLSPKALQWLLALAGVACCVAMSMPQVHIVALCIDLGYGPAVGGQMLSIMLIGGVISRLISGMIADRVGGLTTLLIGSSAQCIALFLYLPFEGLTSLYVVSLIFGLSQGGIVPSYAIIVRELMPAREAGARVGFVIMATILGMALGGWMSGAIYDAAQSYTLAFWNGIAWNFLNIAIAGWLLWKVRGAQRLASDAVAS